MKKAFALGVGVFVLTFCLDLFAYSVGALVLSILMAVGTVLVFASGVIWLIYHDDQTLHFYRGWLIIPLGLFGAGLFETFKNGNIEILPAPEAVETAKNLVARHLQVGLWLVSILLFVSFVLAGSLMKRTKA